MVLTPRQNVAIEKAQGLSASGIIPHLSEQNIIELADSAFQNGKTRSSDNSIRDKLIILTLFDGCLRVSEMLSIRVKDLPEPFSDYNFINIIGKGKKLRQVAISKSLVVFLSNFVLMKKKEKNDRVFELTRPRVHQIIDRAFKTTGIIKPQGVGTNHVMRHSGAIARLMRTGNPKALQDHLGHSQHAMTLRYMKTLQIEESRNIHQEVEFAWV